MREELYHINNELPLVKMQMRSETRHGAEIIRDLQRGPITSGQPVQLFGNRRFKAWGTSPKIK